MDVLGIRNFFFQNNDAHISELLHKVYGLEKSLVVKIVLTLGYSYLTMSILLRARCILIQKYYFLLSNH